MSIRQVAAILCCTIAVAGINAQAAPKRALPKTNFTLVEAYKTKAKPANAQALPLTGEHFIIKWMADTYPATFYWRGQGGFLMCNISKAHKKGKTYTTETVPFDAIHKGDTLEIVPFSRGKVRIPDEIPQNAKNTLFYRVNGNDTWMLFPVKSITKK